MRKKNKPFSLAEVTGWADALLDALNYLHTRKPAIVHRNVNPSNVKIGDSGKIKLLGVGVETAADSDFVASNIDTDKLRYCPLEQIWPGLDPASQKVITHSYDDRSERILKQPLDDRSDIYSLGATLYFLITGIEPIDALERSIEILEGRLDPLREPINVDPDIPADISDVLMKALEIKRENRYDSAVIMRQVLQTALARGEAASPAERPVAVERATPAPVAKDSSSDNEARLRAEREEKQRHADADALRMKQQAEAEERRREAEAAEKLKLEADAEAKRREAEAAEKKIHEAQAEEKRQRELMARELRDAEERRVKAAQDERQRREAEKASAVNAAEVVAYRDASNEVDEAELSAVLRELEEAESETQSKPAGEIIDVSEAPIDSAPTPTADTFADDDDTIFSIPEKTGFSLPMPAIAGIVVLVLVVAVGGWFLMSGSSKPEQPQQTSAPVQVAQPAPVETAPSPEVIVTSAEPQTETVPITESTGSPTQVAKNAPKPKKAEAKPEPAKKKVTADDLINDN